MLGVYMMRRVSLRLCLNQLCWSALGFGPGYSNSAFQAGAFLADRES